MYIHCGNEQALQVVEGMAGSAARWTQTLSEQHVQSVLLVEHSGMNTNPKDPTGFTEPVPNQPLTFRTVKQGQSLALIPLYGLFGERCAV